MQRKEVDLVQCVVGVDEDTCDLSCDLCSHVCRKHWEPTSLHWVLLHPSPSLNSVGHKIKQDKNVGKAL